MLIGETHARAIVGDLVVEPTTILIENAGDRDLSGRCMPFDHKAEQGLTACFGAPVDTAEPDPLTNIREGCELGGTRPGPLHGLAGGRLAAAFDLDGLLSFGTSVCGDQWLRTRNTGEQVPSKRRNTRRGLRCEQGEVWRQ
jgi:hypothetical protein